MTGKLPTIFDHVGVRIIVLVVKAYNDDRIRASPGDRGAFANILPKANRGRSLTSAHGSIASGP